MQNAALSLIGQIAISWNRLESDISRLLGDYLATDATTTKIILKPLRPNAQEVLLRKLILAKETNENIRNEIKFALNYLALLRENRNMIVHTIGLETDDLSNSAMNYLQGFSTALVEYHKYFTDLRRNITSIMIDRDTREIHDGHRADNDELRPLPVFQSPHRPAKFRRLDPDDLV